MGYNGWNTDGGNNTQYKIFLLSYAEANQYYGVRPYSVSDSDNTKSRVAPTAYAIQQGAYISSSTKTGDGAGAGWRWLRSPGNELGSAAHVLADGSIYYIDVNSDDKIVRPALWLNLESEIF